MIKLIEFVIKVDLWALQGPTGLVVMESPQEMKIGQMFLQDPTDENGQMFLQDPTDEIGQMLLQDPNDEIESLD